MVTDTEGTITAQYRKLLRATPTEELNPQHTPETSAGKKLTDQMEKIPP
jgi:hypothetical protein